MEGLFNDLTFKLTNHLTSKPSNQSTNHQTTIIMAEKMYAGTAVFCNEEGYLTEMDQWTKAIGTEIAAEEDIAMTDTHWQVVDYLRDQVRQEVPLTIRKIGKSGVVSIKEFYALFPEGPLKKASRIAGIPKPVSCI